MRHIVVPATMTRWRTYRWRSVILLEGANGASGIANAVVMIVIPWLVLERTGSAAYAGLVVAASSLPGIVVAPLVGAAIDRFGRRLVSIVSDVLSALSVAAFPLVALVQDLTLPWILAPGRPRCHVRPGGLHRAEVAAPRRRHRVRLSARRAERHARGDLRGGVGHRPRPRRGPHRRRRPRAGVLGPVRAVRRGDRRDRRAAGRGRRPGRPTASGESGVGAWQGLLLGARVLWRDKALRAVTIALMVLAAVYLPTESVVLPAYFEGLGRADEPGHPRLRDVPRHHRRGLRLRLAGEPLHALPARARGARRHGGRDRAPRPAAPAARHDRRRLPPGPRVGAVLPADEHPRPATRARRRPGPRLRRADVPVLRRPARRLPPHGLERRDVRRAGDLPRARRHRSPPPPSGSCSCAASATSTTRVWGCVDA